jgi:hypothetical protein
MDEITALFEAWGIPRINTSIDMVYSQMQDLFGDKERGVKSKNAYLAHAKDASAILQPIADNQAIGWNASLRNYTNADARCRYVFAIASIVPPMMRALRDIAYKTDERSAARYFNTILESIEHDNPYRKAGEIFYTALISSVDVMTPSRPGQPTTENLTASREIAKIHNKIDAKYKRVESIVKQVFAVTNAIAKGIDGIEPFKVTADDCQKATYWLIAFDALKRGIFSAEKDEVTWFGRNMAKAKYLYMLAKYSWDDNGDNKSTTAENDELNTEISDDIDEDALLKQPSDTDSVIGDANPSASNSTDETYVVKDMPNLGKNTTQFNTVTPDSKFTCAKYFKVFNVDGLKHIRFSTAENAKTLRMLYHLMKYALSAMNFNFNLAINEKTAPQFADYVTQIFSNMAQSTVKALSFHQGLVEQLLVVRNTCQTGDDEKVSYLVRHLGEGSVDDPAKLKALRSCVTNAVDKIFELVVFYGDYRIAGKLVDGSQIRSVGYPEPVASFGDESRNDRKTTLDLTQSGKVATRYFNYTSLDDDELDKTSDPTVLSVQYDADVGNKVVDTIPIGDVCKIYRTYVSQSLVPAHISHSYAWIVLCGIRCYTTYYAGELGDVQQNTPLTQAMLDTLKDANTFNSAQMSKDTVVANSIKNTNWKDIATAGFINSAMARNADAQTELIHKVGMEAENREVKETLSDIVAIGEAFTKSISAYADAKSVAARDKVYNAVANFSPTLMGMVFGGKDAMHNMVAQYVIASSPDMPAELNVQLNIVTQLYTAYKVLETSDNNTFRSGARKQSYLAIAQDIARCQNLLNTLMTDIQKYPDDVKAVAFKLLPKENYKAISELSSQIYDMFKGKHSSEERMSFFSQHASDFADAATALLNVGHDEGLTWESIMQSIISMVGQPVDDVINNDPLLKKLQDSLCDVIDLMKSRNLTAQKVREVQQSLAACLDTSDKRNTVNKLGETPVNDFMRKVKIFNRLVNIYNKMQQKIENPTTNDVLKFDIPDTYDDTLGEVDPLGVENSANKALHDVRNEIDAEREVRPATDEDNVDVNSVEHLISLLKSMYRAKSDYEAMTHRRDELTNYARKVSNNPEADYKSLTTLPDVASNLQRIASDIDDQIYNTKKTYFDAMTGIRDFLVANPSYDGLKTAVVSEKVSLEDVQYALNIIDIAAGQLKDMVKYDPVQDNLDNPTLRMYAYTKSDESAIAQIIYVLGMHLVAPNADLKEDLVDSLTTIHNILERYSGNRASLSVSNYVLNQVNSANSIVDLNATLVSTICYLGRFIVSRMRGNVADSRYLRNVQDISTPAAHSPNYGRAMDSYARSQLRKRGNKLQSKTTSTTGRADDSEKKARQKYVDLLRNDLKENMPLAKYAYVLGRAFDTFERTMTDERVEDVENRMFNAVNSSLAGVELWKGRAVNDLQREVVSAIIDDEANGDNTYPTVKSVIDAALKGTAVMGYNQMYSDYVYSGNPKDPYSNILNDQKGTRVAFDANGNRVDDGSSGVPLTMEQISKLLFDRTSIEDQAESSNNNNNSKVYDESDIHDIVHDVRMEFFYRIVDTYGSFTTDGIAYKDNYKKASTLMSDAMNSLKKLCDDMNTPLSSIVVATSSVGQRNGRYLVLNAAKEALGDGTASDLETIGLVSDEPGAYPQTMSNEKSQADVDWIDNIARLVSLIPDSLSPEVVRDVVEQYFTTELDRSELAQNPDYAVVIKVIEHLMELDDNATGIPSGFFGNDSTSRANTINALFNIITSVPGDTWKERARKIKADFIEKLEQGKNVLSVGNIDTTSAAARRIAHLRMNPYYATKLHAVDSAEFKQAIDDLKAANLITMTPSSNFVKLAYGDKKLDQNTFTYIVMMAINYADTKSMPITDAFATVVMFYLTGVRSRAYDALMADVSDIISNDNVMNTSAIQQAITGIGSVVNAKPYQNMVKTDLGWFSDKAYKALCVSAIKAKTDNLVDAFKKAADALTAGGTISIDNVVDTITKPASVKKPKPPKPPKHGSGAPSSETETVKTSTEKPSVGIKNGPKTEKGDAPKKRRGKNKTVQTEEVPSSKPAPKIDTSALDSQDPEEGMLDDIENSANEQPAIYPTDDQYDDGLDVV